MAVSLVRGGATNLQLVITTGSNGQPFSRDKFEVLAQLQLFHAVP